VKFTDQKPTLRLRRSGESYQARVG